MQIANGDRARVSNRDARIKITKIVFFEILGPLGVQGDQTDQWDGHLGSFLGQKIKKNSKISKNHKKSLKHVFDHF